MANPPHQTHPTSRPMTVSSLLSPPDKALESFNSSNSSIDTCSPFTIFTKHQPPQPVMARKPSTPEPVYASPPISPYDRNEKPELDTRRASGVRDPVLYASSDAGAVAHDGPLFPREPVEPAAHDIISQHMASPEFASLPSKPSRADYEVTANFVSCVFENYHKDPRGWWKQEQEFRKRYGPPTGIRKNQKATPAKSKLKNLAPAPSSTPRKANKVALPRVERTPRAKPVKRTPKTPVLKSFDSEVREHVSPKPAKEKREDSDFNSVPDFSPPIETLPDNPKALKTDWKGTPLPMKGDPHLHLLHEAEIQCASSLRLTAAVYLTSKRRIFQARIHALKIKKEFRKTDAQQACKIDVNKASKLWEVFHRVGWFNPGYFEQYL